MIRLWLQAGAACLTLAAGAAADAPRSAGDLINDLGDDRYAVRRRAEQELLRQGPEVYDQLKAAEDSNDLEIAERARYIVQRMRVEWVRPDDSAEVRRILARYGDLPEAERLKRIARLNNLAADDGLPALCRIARLEPSPVVARRAALAVLSRPALSGDRPAIATASQAELGSSERAPATWIRLSLGEGADRRQALADWNAAIGAEAALLAEESPETTFEIVRELMERRLELCNELALVDETTAALLEMAELEGKGDADQATNNLARALRWIIDHKRWDVLDQVARARSEQLKANRRLLYYLAAATSRAGRADEATKLADEAFEMNDPFEDEADRVGAAGALAQLGFLDWAEREYRKSIKDLPVVSWESLAARRDWAMWLHDREEYKAAADVLGEFFDVLGENRAARQRLIQQLEGRQYLNSLAARRQFYLACHYESQRDYAKQREALETAFKLYDDDPDILIAMYRSPGAEQQYRQQTVTRIHQMSQKHLALIEQYPDEPSFHNQWAWLIANTEGDYAKAVEHSRRSLELSPDEPSYLDTLGRCYYAADDLENAVKSQQRAVELAPHYGVMRRLLEQFQRELAARKKPANATGKK
jgi:hypothetical protein